MDSLLQTLAPKSHDDNMRLLKRVASPDGDSFSLTLEEHGGSSTPPYAILSHCWDASNEEVSYADLSNLSPEILAKPGYDKIWKCMQHAAEDGFKYLWADTCCIDKTSSAELSEGINSMFAWYRDAAVCYAYLNDVKTGFEDPHGPESEFRASRWFTRGWTLQELIAPRSVIFIAKNWMEIGSKQSLVALVADITKIDEKVLLQQSSGVTSIAKRMSWAAKRQTTRIEDRAYSLMGLFNVNMPTIYGEGHKAFWRLQNEILKVSDDHTIFAYDPVPTDTRRLEWRNYSEDNDLPGMLAESPNQFGASSDYLPLRSDSYLDRYGGFGIRKELQLHQMTNVGFNIALPLLSIESQEMMDSLLRDRDPRRNWSGDDVRLAMIACSGPSKRRNSATCIILRIWSTEEGQHYNQYARISWDNQSTVEVNLDGLGGGAFENKQVYIVGNINHSSMWHPWAYPLWWRKYQFNVNFHPSCICQMIDKAPLTSWQKNSFTSKSGTFRRLPSGAIIVRLLDTAEILFAVFGVLNNKPWCYLEICGDGRNAQEILNAHGNEPKGPLGSGQNLLDWFAVTSVRTPWRKIVMKVQMDKNPPPICTVRMTVYDDHDNSTTKGASGPEISESHMIEDIRED